MCPLLLSHLNLTYCVSVKEMEREEKERERERRERDGVYFSFFSWPTVGVEMCENSEKFANRWKSEIVYADRSARTSSPTDGSRSLESSSRSAPPCHHSAINHTWHIKAAVKNNNALPRVKVRKRTQWPRRTKRIGMTRRTVLRTSGKTLPLSRILSWVLETA